MDSGIASGDFVSRFLLIPARIDIATLRLDSFLRFIAIFSASSNCFSPTALEKSRRSSVVCIVEISTFPSFEML